MLSYLINWIFRYNLEDSYVVYCNGGSARLVNKKYWVLFDVFIYIISWSRSMGGFARYPWPQYINNAPFYYNKNFKICTALAAVSGIINFLWSYRYFKYHHVTTRSFSPLIQDTAASSILNTPTLHRSSDLFDRQIQNNHLDNISETIRRSLRISLSV